MDEVCKKMVPDDILSRVDLFSTTGLCVISYTFLQYMIRTLCGPQELWRMRKTFTLQLAAVSFMTYVVCITQRHPSRFHISRSTGQIYMSELLSGMCLTFRS